MKNTPFNNSAPTCTACGLSYFSCEVCKEVRNDLVDRELTEKRRKAEKILDEIRIKKEIGDFE